MRADEELPDRETDRGAREGQLDGGCADVEVVLKRRYLVNSHPRTGHFLLVAFWPAVLIKHRAAVAG
jgi:hypothetical protein